VDSHNGEVYCISRRQAFVTEHDIPGSFDCRFVHREYFIDHSQHAFLGVCSKRRARARAGPPLSLLPVSLALIEQ
jgi:hypothetical protein